MFCIVTWISLSIIFSQCYLLKMLTFKELYKFLETSPDSIKMDGTEHKGYILLSVSEEHSDKLWNKSFCPIQVIPLALILFTDLSIKSLLLTMKSSACSLSFCCKLTKSFIQKIMIIMMAFTLIMEKILPWLLIHFLKMRCASDIQIKEFF